MRFNTETIVKRNENDGFHICGYFNGEFNEDEFEEEYVEIPYRRENCDNSR